MAHTGLRHLTMPVIILVVGLVKWCVGLGGYSGAADGPMFGDFEAQRHWMEITQFLPMKEWYRFDLEYWGLDYPPLTAYHSLLLGKTGTLFSPSWFALDSSRGFESAGLKAFMRASVLLGEVAVYWSTFDSTLFLWFLRTEHRLFLQQINLLLFLLQPALILIDNGHFQFNSIMLGLTLWSLVFLRNGQRDGLACVAFVASLGFKQMSLYYAPAVGVWLIGKCWNLGRVEGSRLLVKLSLTTVGSFLVVFGPFLHPLSELQQVLHRIFPFARGIFEDKVANFWCASNTVLKWKTLLPTSALPPLALALTFLSLLPSAIHFLYLSHTLPKGTNLSKLLPVLVWESAMSFFLFSFQVHEKSVLVPLLGVLMGMFDLEGGEEIDGWGVLLNNVAVFSLYPLLKKDGLSLRYTVITFLWNYILGAFNFTNPLRSPPSLLKYLSLLTYPAIFLLHALELFLPEPIPSKPDLYVVLNVLVCFGVYLVGWLAGLRRQAEVGWGLELGLGARREEKDS
ncbi:glycosyl transferase [Mrakia frigida]|uniref:dolichyl-P-Glc:Man(9)GlcNAc(2)-PP-dolichol alpha-1,3-glucosyltransferase n=1 Tax=Mrakia frigida TaxID=29902 RepID=UPI003FCC2499